MTKNLSTTVEIGASLNASFGKTMTTAESRIKEFGSGLRKIRQQEDDVNSLIRATGGLKDAQTKHNVELKELNRLLALKNIKRNAEDTKRYNANVEAQRSVVQRTGRAVKDQQRSIDSLGSSLRRAGIDTKNLSTAQKKLALQAEQNKRKTKMLESIKGLNLGPVGSRVLPALMLRFPAFGKAVEKYAPSLANWLPIIGAVVRGLTLFVGSIIALGTGLFMLGKRASDFVENLRDTSDGLNTTIEGLGNLRFSASKFGIETEKMDTALGKFVVNLEEAKDGTGKAKEALDELGLDAVTLQAMDAEEAFAMVADAFKNYQGTMSKGALAKMLFGKGSQKLVSLLNSGSIELKINKEEARKAGLIPSEYQKAQSAEFDAWWENFKMKWDGFLNNLGFGILDMLGFKPNGKYGDALSALEGDRQKRMLAGSTSEFQIKETSDPAYHKSQDEYRKKKDIEFWQKNYPSLPLPSELGGTGQPTSKTINVNINGATLPQDVNGLAEAVANHINRLERMNGDGVLYDVMPA